MYSIHNECTSVVAERFIRTLKGKIYKQMTSSDSKPDFSYLDNSINKHINTYHSFISKKPIDADHSASTEQIETKFKAPKFKVGDRVRTTKCKNIFSKSYSENWSREKFVINSVLKTNLWTCKIKDLNGETIIWSFCEKKIVAK